MLKRVIGDDQIMTYKVLICDDEPSACGYLEENILQYADTNCLKIDVDVFYTGEEMFEYVSVNTDIDLIFLDIELPGKDGAEIGNSLRRDIYRNDIQIVYISSIPGYALRLFEARPFDFLVKPITSEKLSRLLDKYMQIYGKADDYYEYKYNKIENKILLSKILYICSNNKQINIVTENKKYTYYGNIKDLHGKYEMNGFWSVHNSYIVNIKYADMIRDDQIIMCNGDVIPVSRNYKQALKRNLLRLNEVL